MTKIFSVADLPELLLEFSNANATAKTAERSEQDARAKRYTHEEAAHNFEEREATSTDPVEWASCKRDREMNEKWAVVYTKEEHANRDIAIEQRVIAAAAREKIAQVRRDEKAAKAKRTADIEDLM